MPISSKDYPALFVAADNAACRLQNLLLASFIIHSFLIIMGSLLALFSGSTWHFALIAAVLFLLSLIVHSNSEYRNFQGRWYQARALAESSKTATWRFMMKAEPFAHHDDNYNITAFRALLSELLKENRGIGADLSGDYSKDNQVTETMLNTAKLNLQERLSIYLSDRVQEQRNWYALKSKENRKSSVKTMLWTFAFYGCAIILLLIRIAHPNAVYLPVNVFAVSAVAMIGWAQLKRFKELASSYGLTAHEVGIIQTQSHNIHTDAELSDYVADSENAFSREHTQWAARRNHHG